MDSAALCEKCLLAVGWDSVVNIEQQNILPATLNSATRRQPRSGLAEVTNINTRRHCLTWNSHFVRVLPLRVSQNYFAGLRVKCMLKCMFCAVIILTQQALN